jgi:hypothetical protein
MQGGILLMQQDVLPKQGDVSLMEGDALDAG